MSRCVGGSLVASGSTVSLRFGLRIILRIYDLGYRSIDEAGIVRHTQAAHLAEALQYRPTLMMRELFSFARNLMEKTI